MSIQNRIKRKEELQKVLVRQVSELEWKGGGMHASRAVKGGRGGMHQEHWDNRKGENGLFNLTEYRNIKILSTYSSKISHNPFQPISNSDLD